jgi:DNA-binding transcriptional ArsR family regulator
MNLITKRKIKLSQRDERFINAMQILGDKTRYKIFRLLLGDEELCVTEMAEYLGISIPAVSQHLRRFELVGLVEKNRMGQKICYMLKTNDPIVKLLMHCVADS